MFDKKNSTVDVEKKVLKFWKENDCFNKSKEKSLGKEEFTFYDGPPFATGLPHYGHILSGTIKDCVTRYKYQHNYHVERKFGWDCHGLPVEFEIDKKNKITTREQIMEMGIDVYNSMCKSIVMTYSSQWKDTVDRMGRWVDFENGYKTMDLKFMSSVWYIFKQLFDKGYVYRGYKVMPFSTGCLTPLSNFESHQNFKEVFDPSIIIKFPLKNNFKGHSVSMLAWTTTPWTLPSNLGLVVNETFEYVIAKINGELCVILEQRVPFYFKEDCEIIERFLGKDLVGLEYTQPFDYYEHLREEKGFFRIISDDFVSAEDGTGVVHTAPGFGEEDYNSFVKNGLIRLNELVPCPIDEKGKFTAEIGDLEGTYFKDADKIILKRIKDKILFNERKKHNYPFCWRSETPLIYKLFPNWFVRVHDSVDKLLKNNEKINWVPNDIKYNKFHNWLANAKDWSISRNRFWGTPIPLWVSEDYSEIMAIESHEELEKLTGRKITDIHRQFIDDITFEKNGKMLRRVPEVFDCWFESGSMPYAQKNWPFCMKENFNMSQIKDRLFDEKKGIVYNDIKLSNFPADFIGEGIDQTRGWFYTLHVISCLLFDKPAFNNVIVNGIVLAEDSRKMSKKEKNYPDPDEIFNEFGADSLRMYLLSSPVVEGRDLKFKKDGVKEITKTLIIPWFNILSFYCESKNSEVNTGKLELDDWLCNRFNDFLEKVTEKVDKYELDRTLDYALKFIDDLSNWYIRIYRKEIRNGHHSILRQVLINFSIVMAPFTPFFSEYCYQSINPGESVHFEMYPSKFASKLDRFEDAKEVTEGIRSLREKNKISLKTPLKEVKIICADSVRKDIESYINIVSKECNVLKIVFTNNEEISVKLTVKPKFDNLKNDRSTMKKKMDIISKLIDEDIEKLMAEDCITIDGIEITKENVLLEKEIISANGIAKAFKKFMLILDISMDETVTKLKTAREFNSQLQKIRKKFNLNVNDTVYVEINNDHIIDICADNFDINFGTEGEFVGESVFKYNGMDYKIVLRKLLN